MAAPIVAMTGIVKTFGGTHAVNRVDFAVLPGEAHALLGGNGAGKSTLIKIWPGCMRPMRVTSAYTASWSIRVSTSCRLLSSIRTLRWSSGCRWRRISRWPRVILADMGWRSRGRNGAGLFPGVHLVTKENVGKDGGPENHFDPDNKYRNEYRKIWGI